MGNTNDLDSRMNAGYKNMSKGQKLLAAYITDNYDKAVFFTAAKLGAAVGVSESTVVRFAANLGYKGYPEFQRALEERVRKKLSAAQREKPDSGSAGLPKVLEAALRTDIENIKSTLEHMDSNAFEIAVDTLLEAKHIYILGIRSCAALAEFLAFYLNLVHGGARLLHTSSASELFEQMMRIGSEDAIVGISFPRYSMRTLKAMEFANSRNAKIITLTDSVHSPINLYSSCNLIAKSSMTSVLDSLTAPFSVIHALIAALCMKKQEEVADTLELLEGIWDNYQVYGNDEIDLVDDSVRMRHGSRFAARAVLDSSDTEDKA